MKNITVSASPRVGPRSGKLSISAGSKNRKNSVTSESDAFIDDLSITLKSIQTKIDSSTSTATTTTSSDTIEYKGFDKLIQDINSNNLSGYGKPSNLRRLKSWNKGFTKKLRELEENLPSTESLKQTIRQAINNNHNNNNSTSSSRKNSEDWRGVGYSKEQQWKGVGYNVQDNWKGVEYSLDENKVFEKPTTPSTLPLRRRLTSSDIRNTVTQPLRRFSSSTTALQRKLSDSYNTNKSSPVSTPTEEEAPPRFVDFGACYSPDEMKSWGQVIEKLATTIRNTNNATHKRYISISDTLGTLKEPAKKMLSHSLPGSVKRRRKTSYDLHRRSQSDSPDGPNDSSSSQEDVSDTSSPDVSLSREVMDEMFLNSASSFSANVWYHGDLDVRYNCTVNSGADIEEKEMSLCGSILARVDKYGDVVYSITYKIEDDVLIGSFPRQFDRYCLDFLNPREPRFASVKYLIAYLIEQKYLERVTFSWLIDNCDQFLLE